MDLFKNLEQFLRPDSKAEQVFKNLTKQLFDKLKDDQKFQNDKSLDSLVVDFMDDEAIWTQLDNENLEFLKCYIKEFCQNERPDEEDNFVNDDSAVYDTDDSIDEEENLNDEELDDENLNEENLEDESLLDEDDDLMNEEELFDGSELSDQKSDDDDTLFNPKSNQIDYEKELEKMENDDEESLDDSENNDEMMSEFQKQDFKVQQKAKELEEEYLKEKPWQLKGEISATDRPQDSLLEEYVDFESGARPMPVYTEEFTNKLEDIILQRIKTNKYDDVERKERKIEQPFDFKRRIMLETEKSKDGLAKVYENEFLKQKNTSHKEENPLHKEIKEKMRKLFVQLDSLCNFNYVPKAANSEIKLVNNLPAINVEEAIPDAVSDANLIAPQEILPVQKKDLKADDEKTRTDKLRERRLKKQLIKEKIKFKEQNGQITNFKKFKVDKASDKGNDKRSIKMNKDSETVKSVFMKTRKNR